MSKEANTNRPTEEQNKELVNLSAMANPDQYPDLSQKGFHELSIPPFDIANGALKVKEILEKFLEHIDSSLDRPRRLRLNGIGISRYGFTDKVSDMAVGNERFAPPSFDNDELKELLRDIEMLRIFSSLLGQLQRIVNDELLIAGDEAYDRALLFYNTLREQARRRVPGAQVLFDTLRPFFRNRRRKLQEPTAHELERDLHALIHGHKDGSLFIERELPHLTGGNYEVEDNIHRNNDTLKATAQGTLCDHCDTENVNHAKFCINCGCKVNRTDK